MIRGERVAGPRLGSVRWSQAPLVFQLESSDKALLARAATIFRPWRARNGLGPTHRWRVEPTPDHRPGNEGLWEIRSDLGTGVTVRKGSESALLEIEYGAVQVLVEWPQGPLALHGALVARSGQGVLLLGPAEAGKSTLASALWRRGWAFLCDDVALVDPEGASARPAPRRVALRHSSRDLLGHDLWERLRDTPSYARTEEGCVFHPDELDRRVRPASTGLAAVVFLARRGSPTGPACTVRLDPAHALLAMLPYSNLVRALDPGEAIRRVRPVAEAVSAHDLARGPLDEMIRAVDGLLDRR